MIAAILFRDPESSSGRRGYFRDPVVEPRGDDWIFEPRGDDWIFEPRGDAWLLVQPVLANCLLMYHCCNTVTALLVIQ